MISKSSTFQSSTFESSTSKFSIAGGSKAMIAAGLLLCMISTAHAYTAEQQQLCTNDAFKLCSSEIPDVDRVTACMARHKAELSPACKSVFGPAPSEARATPTPTASATPVKASKPLNLVPQKTRRAGA
jgi:hypothetical protein